MTGLGAKIGHSEGKDETAWMLLDYHQIIVHIFSKRSREYYSIDELWGDVKTVRIDDEGNISEQEAPPATKTSNNGTWN